MAPTARTGATGLRVRQGDTGALDTVPLARRVHGPTGATGPASPVPRARLARLARLARPVRLAPGPLARWSYRHGAERRPSWSGRHGTFAGRHGGTSRCRPRRPPRVRRATPSSSAVVRSSTTRQECAGCSRSRHRRALTGTPTGWTATVGPGRPDDRPGQWEPSDDRRVRRICTAQTASEARAESTGAARPPSSFQGVTDAGARRCGVAGFERVAGGVRRGLLVGRGGRRPRG